MRSWNFVLLAICLLICKLSSAQELSERGLMNPTGWWWLTGVAPTTISEKIDQGFRVIDLEIENVSPLRFSTVLVKNTGKHQKGWWWFYGLSAEQVRTRLTDHNARIIDLEIYFVNGEKKYAVVMVSNTGENAKSWWYYSQLEFGQIAERLNDNQGRLVDIDSYVLNGRRYFDVVMIRNRGVDQKAWWYYSNITAREISEKLKLHKARLTDIETHTLIGNEPTYTVIMEKSQGETWWWYYGQTMQQVNELTDQKGARIIDVEPYLSPNGNKLFAVLLLRNTNDLTERMRGYLGDKRSGGSYGLYLKEVQGRVLAHLNENARFYAASTIKALVHLHASFNIQQGSASLDDRVTKYTNEDESCATVHTNHTSIRIRLEDALKEMMRNSDNQSTNAIIEFIGNGNAALGRTRINATAHNRLGMSDNTALHHHFGCGGPDNDPANSLTLVDVGKLYESVATGFFNATTSRDQFYSTMLKGLEDVNTIINEEAAKIGLSSTAVSSFKNDVETAAKAGSFPANGKKYRSIGGWIKLPRKNAKAKEYVFGLFIDAADTSSVDIWEARAELLREQIHQALSTYR